MYGPSKSFNNASGVEVATQQATLLSMIAPNLKMHVAVDTSSKVNVNQAGANAQIQPVRAGLSSVAQEISRTKATAVEAIKTAQAEIRVAAKATGVQPEEVFPDTSMAPDSAAELALGMASGKGSIVTAGLKASNNTSLAGDVAAGMREKPAEEVMQAVKDTLIANSSPDQNESFGGIIVDANEAPNTDQFSINWASVLEQDPEALEKIMYFDESNLAAWPELDELNASEKQVGTALGELDAAETKVTYTAAGVDAAGELPPAQIVGADETVSGGVAIASLDAAKRDALTGLDKNSATATQDLENELQRVAQMKLSTDGLMGA